MYFESYSEVPTGHYPIRRSAYIHCSIRHHWRREEVPLNDLCKMALDS